MFMKIRVGPPILRRPRTDRKSVGVKTGLRPFLPRLLVNFLTSLLLLCVTSYAAASPITGLLERIGKGASRRFAIERVEGAKDFFELGQKGDKVLIRGNNYVSIATGLNWYLKYYAGIHLSWNGMSAELPVHLPPVIKKERHETSLPYRYALDEFTCSTSVGDWERWEKEIDWMALHGVNLAVVVTCPSPDKGDKQQAALQKKILKRMRKYGIGYKELTKRYGEANYYLMNPFHERLHGGMDKVIDRFFLAKADPRAGKTLKGVGVALGGNESNPVMYELVMELPWYDARFRKEEWLRRYVIARYGREDVAVQVAWDKLANTIYSPGLDLHQHSAWPETKAGYDPQDVIEAARLMVSVADNFRGNANFEYDLMDIVRRAIAEKGRWMQEAVAAASRAGDKMLSALASQKLLDLIQLRDELLGTRAGIRPGKWNSEAPASGWTPQGDRINTVKRVCREAGIILNTGLSYH